MARKCPQCGKEILCLLVYRMECVTYTFDGEDYEEIDRESNLLDPVDEFVCPECDQVIAENEKDARKLLIGGE